MTRIGLLVRIAVASVVLALLTAPTIAFLDTTVST